MSSLFQSVGAARVPRSVFNLSYNKKLSCDMGMLIPVLCDEMIPGDVFDIGYEAIIRMQPLVAPILHQIDVFVHYFFVPYRLMDSNFETFISGGVAGTDTSSLDRWEPTDTTAGSLWDYLGFPVGVDPDGAYPLDFPRVAYNWIYNDYYRDENLITAVALTNEDILFRCWQKDYFTSALPWQQRGTSPAMTTSGSSSAVWTTADFTQGTPTTPFPAQFEDNAADPTLFLNTGTGNAITNAVNMFNSNTVDLSAATYDLSDMRLAFAIQRWMERNARGGVRYVEFLRTHYGTSPRDDTLQRPAFIGGSRMPVIVSEVLQTSQTDTTAQGNMSGHGLSVDRQRVCRYRCNEFGLVMGIMSIMPKPAYNSQGINRQWLRTTRYDFYSPEFANLSEQPILQAEIYATATDTENEGTFGFQGVFDEMRVKHDMCVADMRSTFNYWHLSRTFASAPSLNAAFVTLDGTESTHKRIFAAPSEDGFLVNFGNIIRGSRPLPFQAEPQMWSR